MNLSFFSVPVFTTGLVTVICPSPPLFGLFVFFSPPWSRDISFVARVYYSCLFSQTVCTVLLSQSILSTNPFCGLLHSHRQGISRFPQIGVVVLTCKKIVPLNRKHKIFCTPSSLSFCDWGVNLRSRSFYYHNHHFPLLVVVI